MVLNGSGFNNEATTSPNLYATSDFLALSNGSTLPGAISGSLSVSSTSLALDVINGFGAATFTLNVFNSANTLVNSVSAALTGYTAVGSTARLALSASDIRSFTVTTTQTAGSKDFAIDTVSFSGVAAAVPEPATWAMMIAGFGLAGFALRRRPKVRTNVSFA